MSYRISMVQCTPFLCRKKNISLVNKYIQENTQSDLIIFPELSLNGYSLQDGVFSQSFSSDELEQTFSDVKQDIIISCAFRDELISIACVYISQGKILHIHKKNHLPNYTFFQEARFFSKSNDILSFESKFGNTVMLLCEDLWNGETMSKVSKLNASLIVVASSSPSRDFENELSIKKQWYALLASLNIFTKSYVVFVNRVGFEDGLGFWGGSKAISPDGIDLSTCELFDEDVKDFEFFTKDENSSIYQEYIPNNK